MTPTHALEVLEASNKKNSDFNNHLIETNQAGEAQICRVLVLSEDTKISNILAANPQLEPTYTLPQDFLKFDFQHYNASYDVLIIDTASAKLITAIELSKLTCLIIFIQDTSTFEQKQDHSESAYFLSYSELTSESLMQCILEAIKKSKFKQVIEENEYQLNLIIKGLQERHSFLTEVLDQIPLPIFVKDQNLRYIAYNKAFKDTYIEEGDWHGKTLLDIKQNIYKNPKAIHEGQLKLLEENTTYSQEYDITTNNNQTLSIIGTASAFDYLDGKKQGLIGIVQDISHQKATEHQLAKSLKAQETLNTKLELLNQLSLELSQATHIDKILDVVCRKTKKIIETERVSVSLPTSKEKHFKIYVCTGQQHGYIDNGKPVLDTFGAIEKTIASKKMFVKSSLGAYKSSKMLSQSYQAGMMSPIVIDDVAVAVLSVATNNRESFEAREQLWLQQITSIISTTLQRQTLLEQTQTALSKTEIQAQRLEGLNALSKELILASNGEAICKMVLSKLPTLMPSKITSFAFPDSNNEFMETYVLSDDANYIKATGNKWAIEHSPLGDVVTQRKIIHLNLEGNNNPKMHKGVELGLRSYMGAPLIIGDKVLGTINVTSTFANAFTAEDEAFMLQVASLTAATLEHKKLFEESQQTLEQLAINEEKFRSLYAIEQRKSNELELLERVQKAIANKLTLEQIFDTVIDTLRELVDYKAFAFSRLRDGCTYHKKSQACCYPSIYDDYSTTLNKGILGRAATSGKPILVKDVSKDPDYIPLFDDVVSNIAVPVYNGSKIMGMLMVEHIQPLDTTDLNLIVKISEQLSIAIENTTLHEQTRTALHATELQTKRLLGLNKLTTELMTAQNHEAICRKVINELPKLIECDTVYFAFLTEDDEHIASFRNNEDGTTFEATGRTWPIKNVSIGEAISKKEIIRLNFETSNYIDCAFALTLGLRSGMLAPLIVEDQVLGSLSIVSEQANAFSEQDEAFMHQVASLAATTIKNKKLFEESQQTLTKLKTSEEDLKALFVAEARKSNELMILGRVQSAIADKLSLDQIYETAIETLSELLDYRAIAFSRVIEDRIHHIPSQAYGYPNIYNTYSSPIGQGIRGQAATSGKAVLVEDVHIDPNYVTIFADVVSNIAVPIYKNLNILGILEIEHTECLTEEDLSLAIKISEQLSIAIENASLHEQTKTALNETDFQAKRLIGLNKLTKELMVAPSQNAICNMVLNELPKLINSDFTTFSFLSKDKNNILETFQNSEDGQTFEPTGRTWPIENVSLGMAISKRKIIVSDFEISDYLDCSVGHQFNLLSGMVAPLIVEDKVFGTINVTSKHKNAYTEQDKAFLLQVASLTAATIENKKLYEESQQTLLKLKDSEQELFHLFKAEERKSNELMLLERVQSTIANKLSLEQIFETTVKTIAEFLDYRAISLGHIKGNRIHLHPLHSYGYEGVLQEGYSVALDEGIQGLAISKSSTVLVPSVHKNPHYNLVIDDIVSNLAVPIFSNDSIVAVLIVEHTSLLTETDTSLVGKIAEQLTIAIENATLQKQILCDLNYTEALNKINQLLYSTSNIQHHLPEIITITGDAVSAEWILTELYDVSKDVLLPEHFYKGDKAECLINNSQQTPILRSSLKGTTSYQVVDRKEALVTTKTVSEQYLSDHNPLLQHSIGMMSTITIPFYNNLNTGKVSGVASASRLVEQGEFTDTDLHFLNSVVHQVSVAITQQNLNKRIEFQAFHDALTGLPNRNLFEKHLKEEMDFANKKESNVALLFLDLDSFKHINDTFGHNIGDQLLKLVSKRLKNKLREFDTLARMGGDEFAIILANVNSRQEALNIASRFLEALETPFVLNNNPIIVTASIGLSIFPEDGQETSALLKHADVAMYLAKDEGKNGVRAFSQNLADNTKKRLTIENDLRLATDNNEFMLYYQPQYCLNTGQFMGSEALIRWNHPTNGLILPSHFIPIAEETLLIVEMGRWAMFEACRQTVEWHKQGHTITISVNVAAPQFKQANFIETVKRSLETSGLEAKYLELEVTEGVVMDNIDLVASKLQQLRDLGVSIALDDFGTGFSSLRYLQNLPFDKLKIDRSFIMNIGQIKNDQHDKVLVKNIMQLAKGFELKVIAEGIETIEQANYLQDLDCQFAQGFYYARPTPAIHVFDNSSKVIQQIAEPNLETPIGTLPPNVH